jgi:hypothetical protein
LPIQSAIGLKLNLTHRLRKNWLDIFPNQGKALKSKTNQSSEKRNPQKEFPKNPRKKKKHPARRCLPFALAFGRDLFYA